MLHEMKFCNRWAIGEFESPDLDKLVRCVVKGIDLGWRLYTQDSIAI
jgi:hypothetical protein